MRTIRYFLLLKARKFINQGRWIVKNTPDGTYIYAHGKLSISVGCFYRELASALR